MMPVDTNILIFDLKPQISGADFEKKLLQNDIKIAAFGKQTIRFVTHMDFTDEMLERVEKVLKGIR
jgi:threonine aldolase